MYTSFPDMTSPFGGYNHRSDIHYLSNCFQPTKQNLRHNTQDLRPDPNSTTALQKRLAEELTILVHSKEGTCQQKVRKCFIQARRSNRKDSQRCEHRERLTCGKKKERKVQKNKVLDLGEADERIPI